MHGFFGITAMFARRGLLLLAALLFCASTISSAANAQIGVDISTTACIFPDHEDLNLAGAMKRAARGDCPGRLSTGEMRNSWLVKSGLALAQKPAEPLSVHLKQTLFEEVTLYVRYADGTVWTTRHDAASAARHTELGGMFRLRIPWRPGTIETIALHAEKVVDPRGAFVRPAVETPQAESIEIERQSLTYGLFGGVILATLFFNLVLLVWLRYAFLFFYCGMTAATLFYGIAASGILMRLLPAGLPPMLGNVAAEAILPVMLWFAVVFTITLLERGTVHMRLGIAGIALATLQVGAGVIALITLFQAPALLHIPLAAVNILGALTMALIFPLAIIAWRRGSRIILIYTVAWAVPLAGAFARILVALGFMETSAFERDEARAREIELTYLAETDALTGLLNRRAFIEYGIRRSGKGKLKSRLLLIDIDHFKTVNDGFGHEFGDRVLREAGRLLESISPANGVAGRLGGEEFGLIVPYTERDDTAGTILRAFRATPMTDGIRITVSIGSASGIIADDRTWRQVYRRADAALYEAKRTGRDRHVPAAGPDDPSVATAA